MATFSSGVNKWISKKTHGDVERDTNGVPLMTPSTVKHLCLEANGYECEDINDTLYLHHKGFSAIGGLEAYVHLKCLYLESNGITAITGIQHLHELRCLFLQQNLLKSLSYESFQGLDALVTLDISQNLLTSLSGISALSSLQTLNASKNNLASKEALEDLANCHSLVSVDIRANQFNQASDLEPLDLLSNMTALYFHGNPAVKDIRHYRKVFVVRFSRLTYLDERPVDPQERLFAEAWVAGGTDAESAARDQWKQKQADETRAQLASWNEFREKSRLNPAPTQKFVTYRTISNEDEERREEQRRIIAKAEAEAEKLAVLGNGIQMMGLEFAKETARLHGSDFDSNRLDNGREENIVEHQLSVPVEQPVELSEENGPQLLNVAMSTVPPIPPSNSISNIDPTSLQAMVRGAKFDFAKAAEKLNLEHGIRATAEECRLQFASTIKKVKSESSVQVPVISEFGVPMPKITMTTPILPSMHEPELSETEETKISNPLSGELDDARDDKPLSRKEILAAISGTSNHPLSVELDSSVL